MRKKLNKGARHHGTKRSRGAASNQLTDALLEQGLKIIFGNHQTRRIYVEHVASFDQDYYIEYVMEALLMLVFFDDWTRQRYVDTFSADEQAMQTFDVAMQIRSILGLDVADRLHHKK